MKAIKIDKRPPHLTGEPREDAQKTEDYLNYLREQINFAFAQIYKEVNGKEDR